MTMQQDELGLDHPDQLNAFYDEIRKWLEQ